MINKIIPFLDYKNLLTNLETASLEPTNHNLIIVPKVFKPTNMAKLWVPVQFTGQCPLTPCIFSIIREGGDISLFIILVPKVIK